MLPARNKKDLEDIPETARQRLRLVWLERVEQAVAEAIGEIAPVRAGEAARVADVS